MRLSAQAPLHTGEKMPGDLKLANVLRYSSGEVSLREFSGKLLIIDFFNTYCGNCIEALPRLDLLQKEFGAALQILVVSNESVARVKAFLLHNAIAKDVSLPFVTDDRELGKLFPHIYFPHEVWVYKGKVIAITGAEYITAANIHEVISGRPVDLDAKTDRTDFNYHASLLTADSGLLNGNSLICGPIGGAATRRVCDTNSTGKIFIRFINYSLLDLYRYGYGFDGSLAYSHILVKAVHPEHFIYRGNTEYRSAWNREHTFCYEAAFAAGTPESVVCAKIRSDLDAHFGLASGFRDTLCETMLLVNDGPRIIRNPAAANGDMLNFITAGDLLLRLNHDFTGVPFYSALPADSRLDLYLAPVALKNTERLAAALAPYHLSLQPVEKKQRVLVIADADLIHPKP